MRICVVLLIACLSFATYASQKAVTDEGEVVILNDDGTWVYNNPNQSAVNEIPMNPLEFKKSPNSTFNLRSTKLDLDVSIDPEKWSFKKAVSNEYAEYEFQLKDGDLYGMLITEEIQFPMEKLAQIAVVNAQSFAPGTKMVNREYRVVNGLKVIYMEMQGSAEGVDFTYRGYYFSNKNGSAQLVTYTGTSIIDKFDAEIQEFLNGLSVR